MVNKDKCSWNVSYKISWYGAILHQTSLILTHGFVLKLNMLGICKTEEHK